MTPHQELTATLATTPVLKASFVGVTGPQGPPGPEGPAGPTGPAGPAGPGVGPGTANHVPVFTDPTTLGDSVIVQSGGNIGIGTADPQFPLHFVGSALLDGGDGRPNTLAIRCQPSAPGVWLGTDSNGTFLIEDINAVPRVVVTQDGRVGIGQSPTHPLDVAGDVNCTGQFLISGTPHMMLTQEQYDALVARIAALEAKS